MSELTDYIDARLKEIGVPADHKTLRGYVSRHAYLIPAEKWGSVRSICADPDFVSDGHLLRAAELIAKAKGTTP